MEKTLSLSPRNGLIIGVVALAFILFRITTVGAVQDENLNKAIVAELRNELGNNLSKAMASGERDPEYLATLADAERILVIRTEVSKPLLSSGSEVRAVVKVTYQLPEQDTHEVYWSFSHSSLGGWRYLRDSSAVSYYLNFL